MSAKVTLEAALRELQTKGGDAALFDDVRCRGVLADRLPDERARTTAAVAALKAGVASRLKATQPELAREAVARETTMLTRDHAVAQNYAAEAVAAWARVLGLDVPAAEPSNGGGEAAADIWAKAKAFLSTTQGKVVAAAIV